MLTQIHVAIWCHYATMSQSDVRLEEISCAIFYELIWSVKLNWKSCIAWENMEVYIYHLVVTTVSADGLALLGTKPSVNTVMTKLMTLLYTGTVLEGILMLIQSLLPWYFGGYTSNFTISRDAVCLINWFKCTIKTTLTFYNIQPLWCNFFSQLLQPWALKDLIMNEGQILDFVSYQQVVWNN